MLLCINDLDCILWKLWLKLFCRENENNSESLLEKLMLLLIVLSEQWSDARFMLAQRLRRWPNMKPASDVVTIEGRHQRGNVHCVENWESLEWL